MSPRTRFVMAPIVGRDRIMCAMLLAMITTLPPATSCHAQEQKDDVLIGGRAPTTASSARTCVDVQIGDQKSFGCLNQQLRREVDKVKPLPDTAPIDARSSDLKTGVVNIPAIQQQFGRNFGLSVIPQRDPSVQAIPGLRR